MITKIEPKRKVDPRKPHSCWIIWPRLFLDEYGGVYRVWLERVQRRKVEYKPSGEQMHWLYETRSGGSGRGEYITHKEYLSQSVPIC